MSKLAMKSNDKTIDINIKYCIINITTLKYIFFNKVVQQKRVVLKIIKIQNLF